LERSQATEAVTDPAAVGMDGDAVQAVLSAVDDQVEQGQIPGVVLAASRHEHVFLRYATGTTPDGEVCPDDLIFPTMSFGKAITASAIARVQAGGGFEWDEPVSRYLPDYAQKGKESTTIRHLLTHAAGVPSAGLGVSVARPDEWTDLVASLCSAEAEWPPGSRTEYHGLSAITVGAEIARRASGRSWDELYHDVLDPIGCGATMEIPAPGRGVVRSSPPPEPDQVQYHPAGGYFTRVDDILRILQLHLDGGRHGGRVVLPEAAVREMHRAQYAEQIETARRNNEPPVHEWWAIGFLLRGSCEESWSIAEVGHWFGLAQAPTADAFSHAGTSTVLGIAEPSTGVAVGLGTTAALSEPAAVRLRATAARLLGAIGAER
jgi:CubicO group peptidase (beta-lactamase class C family)